MEAGGFEPPSRDVSRQASTCLVALLKFALLIAKRQAFNSAISGLNLTKSARTTDSTSLLSDALTQPADKTGQDGLLN